jgi:CDP-6-deoxy-D-xylo-4-hexulose-3-dehydrase|tara:strand:+ start:62 stop:1243 length:1182 start_codon:yes stop_codon:yes gene_type:complete
MTNNVVYPLATSSWGTEEIDAINDVVASGRFTMGEKVAQFEKEFAEYFGSKHAVMVNSGSTANLLMVSLLKWRHNLTRFVKPNIIVPAVGWSTTYFPLTQNGFVCNFVDVDPETYNINVEKIEQAINKSTVAIMPVNLCGNPADYESIKQLCAKYKLLLLEDNCESMGGKWQDRHLGTLGFAGSHSFFFSHHLQTMEGGMICTPNEDDYHWLKSLRAHGWCRELPDEFELYNKTGSFFKDSFTFVTPGYSVRPLEMSGAIGSVQLKKWPKLLEQRIKNYNYFKELFGDFPHMRMQKVKHGESTWFSFGCVLQGKLKGRRDEVIKQFDTHGIEARPLASGNFLKQPVINLMPHYNHGNYTGAEDIDENGFWVGNHSTDCKEGILKMYSALKDIK